ncbi:MAG: hypothetical protein ACFFDN_07725 [Candidatus Hodarchaeota archaeon]
MEIFTGELPFIDLKREDMLKVKFSRSILPIIYAHLMPKIKEKWGLEKGVEKLRAFGKRVMDDLLLYWTPKGDTVSKVCKDTYKTHFYIKLYKVKQLKKQRPRLWFLYDKTCPLCWEGVEETEIHYCVAYAAAVERLLNTLNQRGYKKIPQVKVNTITSKACGDELCTHEITEII